MLKSSDIAPLMSGFLSSLILVYGWIRFMQARELGQFIREDGPKEHLKKAGIPTMGGLGFLLGALLSSAFFLKINMSLAYIYVSILLFALVGFYDDYKKLKKKRNEGLSAKGKFLLILLISVLIYVEFLRQFILRIPFTDIAIERVALIALFIALLYSAVSNATNFTDGIDGLLTVATLPISLLFVFTASVKGMEELRIFNLIFFAALLGYYVFNKYPAKVFMGDLGSLAIGAYVVSNAVLLDIYWFIPLFGLWYVIEVSSVIIQVLYFKKTGGKRFFKMAPFHHHLEYSGFNEKKIDLLAFCVTAFCSVLSFFLIK